MIKIAAIVGGAALGLQFETTDEHRRFKSEVNIAAPHMRTYHSWTGLEIHVRPSAVDAYGNRRRSSER